MVYGVRVLSVQSLTWAVLAYLKLWRKCFLCRLSALYVIEFKQVYEGHHWHWPLIWSSIYVFKVKFIDFYTLYVDHLFFCGLYQSLFISKVYDLVYVKCQNISIQTFINMLEDSDDFFVLLRKISTHKLEAQELWNGTIEIKFGNTRTFSELSLLSPRQRSCEGIYSSNATVRPSFLPSVLP
jgi:hypothetical protein